MMQNTIYNPAYNKAFVDYLRHGKAITKKYYMPEVPECYVWRTQGDSKVRTAHQENNGKVFTRNNPPATGHPGEDYNCRCIAEPYIQGVTEYANQTVISDTSESSDTWGNVRFIDHARNGGGKDLTLRKTGHLNGVINYYFYTLGIMKRVNQQIVQKAKELGNSQHFEYFFKNSYIFGSTNGAIQYGLSTASPSLYEKLFGEPTPEYLYCFGGSVVRGTFKGEAIYHNNFISITGIVDYEYEDEFTDPASIREYLIDTSDLDEMKKAIKRAENSRDLRVRARVECFKLLRAAIDLLRKYEFC